MEEAIERVSGSRLEGMTLKIEWHSFFRGLLYDEHRKLNISRRTYTYAYTRSRVCYMLNGMGSSAYIPACLSKISWNRSTYCIIIDILRLRTRTDSFVLEIQNKGSARIPPETKKSRFKNKRRYPPKYKRWIRLRIRSILPYGGFLLRIRDDVSMNYGDGACWIEYKRNLVGIFCRTIENREAHFTRSRKVS